MIGELKYFSKWVVDYNYWSEDENRYLSTEIPVYDNKEFELIESQVEFDTKEFEVVYDDLSINKETFAVIKKIINPIKLSILIPSIYSRFDKAFDLYNRLLKEAEGLDIEILMLTDNKKRSIGKKRDDLKNLAKGKYFMFVDDDDDLINLKAVYEATDKDVDVITFKQKCLNKDGSNFIVTFGLNNEIEHNNINGIYSDCKRPPFHVCAWNKKYKVYEFPDVNYGEDWGWLRQFVYEAQTEFFIDEIIHSYNFDINVTEADTSNNNIWQNPNHESNS